MAEFSVTIQGIKTLADLADLPKANQRLAQLAINKIARDARSQSGKLLRQQLNFPARYLSGKDGKITLKPASTGNLQATLSASSDPRSLARFQVGTARGRGKIKVEVQPGGVRSLPGAFLLNIGENSLLAVRSPTKPKGAFKPRRLGKSLWLLYGPSVSQALLHDQGQEGIWVDMEDDLAGKLEVEYLRLLKLENF